MKSRRRRLLETAGGGAIALTLSACYGAAPQYRDHNLPPPGACTPTQDVDGDGFCEDDCDQASRDIHPDATDPPGDALDQDCDGADGKAGAEAAGPQAAGPQTGPADATIATP